MVFLAEGGIGALGLNIPSLIAQLINFTILFLVLGWAFKRFLFPLLDERRRRIQAGLGAHGGAGGGGAGGAPGGGGGGRRAVPRGPPPRRYAEAAFEIAREAGTEQRWSEGLSLVAAAFSNPEMVAQMQEARIPTANKVAVAEKTLAGGEPPPVHHAPL